MDELLDDVETFITQPSDRVSDLLQNARTLPNVYNLSKADVDVLQADDKDSTIKNASEFSSNIKELRHECFNFKAVDVIQSSAPDWKASIDAQTGSSDMTLFLDLLEIQGDTLASVIRELTKNGLMNLKPDYLAVTEDHEIQIFDWKSVKYREAIVNTYNKYDAIAEIFRNHNFVARVVVVNYDPDTCQVSFYPASETILDIKAVIEGDNILSGLVRDLTFWSRKIDGVFSKYPAFNANIYSIPPPTRTLLNNDDLTGEYLAKCPIDIFETAIYQTFKSYEQMELTSLQECNELVDAYNVRCNTTHNIETFVDYFEAKDKTMTKLEWEPVPSKKIIFGQNPQELQELILQNEAIREATKNSCEDYHDTKVNFHIPIVSPVLTGASVAQTLKDFIHCSWTVLTSAFSEFHLNKAIPRTHANHKGYLSDLFKALKLEAAKEDFKKTQHISNSYLTDRAKWINCMMHVNDSEDLDERQLLNPEHEKLKKQKNNPYNAGKSSEKFIIDDKFIQFEKDLLSGLGSTINGSCVYEDAVKKELLNPFLKKVETLNVSNQEKKRVTRQMTDYSNSNLYRIAEYISHFAHGIIISSKFTNDGIRLLSSKSNNLMCIQARGSALTTDGTAAYTFFALVDNDKFPDVYKTNSREIHSWTKNTQQTLVEFLPMRLDHARLAQLTRCFSNTMNLELRNDALYNETNAKQKYDTFSLLYTLSCTLTKTGIFDPIKHIFGCCIAKESDLPNFITEKYKYTVQSQTDWILWKHVNKILQQISDLSMNVDISKYYIEEGLLEDMGAKIVKPINDFLSMEARTTSMVHLVNSMLLAVYMMPKALQSRLPNLISLCAVPAEMEKPLLQLQQVVEPGTVDYIVKLMDLPEDNKFYYDHQELDKILNWHFSKDREKNIRIRQTLDKEGNLNTPVTTIKTMTSAHSTIDSTKRNGHAVYLPMLPGVKPVAWVHANMEDPTSLLYSIDHHMKNTPDQAMKEAHAEVRRLLQNKVEVSERWGEAAYVKLQRAFLGHLTVKKLSKMNNSIANNPKVKEWFKDAGVDVDFLETNSVRNELYALIQKLNFDDIEKPTVIDIINKLATVTASVKLFAKGQRSLTDREIYISDMITKMFLFYTETMFKAACKLEESEAITQPGDKKVETMFEMARSHIMRADKYYKATGIRMDIIDVTGDCSKWSANDNIAKMCQVTASVPWLSLKEKRRIITFFIKLSKKNMHLDMDVLAKIMKNRAATRRDPDDPFNILCDEDGKIISNIMVITSNWLQGNLNYCSSYIHAIGFEAFKEKITALAVELNVTNFCITGMVHSDDFMMVMSGDFNKALVTIAEFRAAVFDLLQKCYKAVCIKINSKKSFLSDIYFEFVSKPNCYGEQLPDYASCIVSSTGECAHSGHVEDILSLGSHLQNAALRNAPVSMLIGMQYSMQYQVLSSYNKLPNMKNAREKTVLTGLDASKLPLCLDGLVCVEPVLLAYGGTAISDCKLMYEHVMVAVKKAGLMDTYHSSPLKIEHVNKVLTNFTELSPEGILTFKCLQYCLDKNEFCEEESKKTMQVINYPKFFSKGKLWKSPFYKEYRQAVNIRNLAKKQNLAFFPLPTEKHSITEFLKPAETVGEYKFQMKLDFSDIAKFQQMSNLNTSTTALRARLVTASACFRPKYKESEDVIIPGQSYADVMAEVVTQIRTMRMATKGFQSMIELYFKEFYLISMVESTRTSMINKKKKHYIMKRLVGPPMKPGLSNRADVCIAFNHDRANFVKSEWKHDEYTILSDSQSLTNFERLHPIKYDWTELQTECSQPMSIMSMVDFAKKLKTITRYVKRHLKPVSSNNVYCYTLSNHTETFLGCYAALFGSLFQTGVYHVCIVAKDTLWSLAGSTTVMRSYTEDEIKRTKIARNFLKAIDNVCPSTFTKQSWNKLIDSYSIDNIPLRSIVRDDFNKQKQEDLYRNMGLYKHMNFLEDSDIQVMLNTPNRPVVVWHLKQIKIDGTYQGMFQAVVHFHSFRMLITSDANGKIAKCEINFDEKNIEDSKFTTTFKTGRKITFKVSQMDTIINTMFSRFMYDGRFTNKMITLKQDNINVNQPIIMSYLRKFDKVWKYGLSANTQPAYKYVLPICNVTRMHQKDEDYQARMRITAYWPQRIPLIHTVYITCTFARSGKYLNWMFAPDVSEKDLAMTAQHIAGSLKPNKYYTYDVMDGVQLTPGFNINGIEAKKLSQFVIDNKNSDNVNIEDALRDLMSPWRQTDSQNKLTMQHRRIEIIDMNTGNRESDRLFKWMDESGLVNHDDYLKELSLPFEEKDECRWAFSQIEPQYLINQFPEFKFWFEDSILDPISGMRFKQNSTLQQWTISSLFNDMVDATLQTEINRKKIFHITQNLLTVIKRADAKKYAELRLNLSKVELAQTYKRLGIKGDEQQMDKWLKEVKAEIKTYNLSKMADTVKHLYEIDREITTITERNIFRENMIDSLTGSENLNGDKITREQSVAFMHTNYPIVFNDEEIDF